MSSFEKLDAVLKWLAINPLANGNVGIGDISDGVLNDGNYIPINPNYFENNAFDNQ